MVPATIYIRYLRAKSDINSTKKWDLLGQVSDLFVDGPPHIAQRQQLNGVVLGKDQQATFIVRGRFYEAPNLVTKLVEGLHRAGRNTIRMRRGYVPYSTA